MDNEKTKKAKEFADRVIELLKEYDLAQMVFLVKSDGHLMPGVLSIDGRADIEMLQLLNLVMAYCRGNAVEVKFHQKNDGEDWKTTVNPKQN